MHQRRGDIDFRHERGRRCRKVSILNAITNSIVRPNICKCYDAYKKLICAQL